MMSQEKEMAIGFMLAFSENPDKLLDSIHSQADVEHLIALNHSCKRKKKTICAKPSRNACTPFGPSIEPE